MKTFHNFKYMKKLHIIFDTRKVKRRKWLDAIGNKNGKLSLQVPSRAGIRPNN